MDHSLQIALQRRKQQQWTHIEHQYSIYKKNYQGRPILPKQVNTFLQFTGFITQLIPTFNHHYFQALTNEESAFISQLTSALFLDLQAKIRSLAHRIEKKEIEENNYKDVKTLCKACLHELREAEIKEARQTLEGREILAQNIMKIIREVEETSEPFSLAEDERFFNDLRAVLKKKQEVIQLCQNETSQFISMIDEQLRNLLINKDELMMREDRGCDQPTIKGYELKENVSKSLRTHLNEKIPEIIKLVRASLQKWEEKKRKLRTANTAVQTIDGESMRIMEMKRRISALESELQQANNDKSQLSWAIEEKNLKIGKYEHEQAQLSEQLSSKTYELQKEIKLLEEKNRKLREEIDKQKSRRYLESSQSHLKSFNSIAQIKQTSFAQEPLDESVSNDVRKGKKKVTITSANKSSGKFYLPTLKRINVEDSQVTLLRESSKNYYEQEQSFTEPQQVNRAIVKDTYLNEEKIAEPAKVSLVKAQSKASLKSKSKERERKKIERLMTLNNTKDSIKQEEKSKKPSKVRTERATEGRQSLNESHTLPLLKPNNTKTSNFNKKKDNKKINNSLNKKEASSRVDKEQNVCVQQKQVEKIVMRQQAREVSQKLAEKVYERSNSLSSVSNKSVDISTKRIPRQSVYKEKHQVAQRATVHALNTMDSLPSKQSKLLKTYLTNSFSKINQEIDKESYMTPLLTSQQASLKDLQRLQENNSVKRHLLQIYRDISEAVQPVQEITLEKFTEYFTNYIQVIKSKNNEGTNSVNFSDRTIAQGNTQPPQDSHTAVNPILISEETRENMKSGKENKLPKERLDVLKTNLLSQINKSITKQSSLNTTYRPSPEYTADSSRPPKAATKQLPALNSSNFLLTLEALLFFNEEIAFQYETNFSRKKQKVTAMTGQIELYLKDLFAVLEGLRQADEGYYHTISGFLRYPYSHSQNGFLQLDILKTLSFNALTQCFLRILGHHKRCQAEKQVCDHLLNFRNILQIHLKKERSIRRSEVRLD